MNELEPVSSMSHPGSQLAVAETASSAVAAQATAIVQARYVIALKNPRDLDTVREKLLKECKRPGFAQVARYNKPVGQGITGPSIRFAEAALRCMGNVVIETMTLFDDKEKRIVQVNVTDLEANVPYTSSITIDKTVERKSVKDGDVIIGSRINSKNEKVFIVCATEDQLLNKQNALVSKAIRTNGLRLVPGDIVEECMWEVQKTQKNADAKDPDGAKLQLFDAFGELGVTVAQIKKHLGHDGNTLTPKELVELRGLYSAIKDGETSWREVEAEKAKTAKNLSDMLEPKKTAEPEKTADKTTEAPAFDKQTIIDIIEGLMLDKEVSEEALAKAATEAGHKLPAKAKKLADLDEATLKFMADYLRGLKK